VEETMTILTVKGPVRSADDERMIDEVVAAMRRHIVDLAEPSDMREALRRLSLWVEMIERSMLMPDGDERMN
jgi:hypothetical protein